MINIVVVLEILYSVMAVLSTFLNCGSLDCSVCDILWGAILQRRPWHCILNGSVCWKWKWITPTIRGLRTDNSHILDTLSIRCLSRCHCRYGMAEIQIPEIHMNMISRQSFSCLVSRAGWLKDPLHSTLNLQLHWTRWIDESGEPSQRDPFKMPRLSHSHVGLSLRSLLADAMKMKHYEWNQTISTYRSG